MKLSKLCTIALLVANPSCVAIKQGFKSAISAISKEKVKPDTLKIIQPDTLAANLPKAVKDSFNTVAKQVDNKRPKLSEDSIKVLQKEAERYNFKKELQRRIDSVYDARSNEKLEQQVTQRFMQKAGSSFSSEGYCLRATKKAIEEYAGYPMKSSKSYKAADELANEMVDKDIFAHKNMVINGVKYKKGDLIYKGTGAHLFEELTDKPEYAEIKQLNKDYINKFWVYFKNIKDPEKKSPDQLKKIVDDINNKPEVNKAKEALRSAIQTKRQGGIIQVWDKLVKTDNKERWFFNGHAELTDGKGNVAYGGGWIRQGVFPTNVRFFRQKIHIDLPQDTTLAADTLVKTGNNLIKK
ncbi:MAG: hypothetical protein GX568_01425 [Candidatus Gastranaerophilales bacterium]|nr:hypothetical protein [Candidatus Gastranaerophilales bacterium]